LDFDFSVLRFVWDLEFHAWNFVPSRGQIGKSLCGAAKPQIKRPVPAFVARALKPELTAEDRGRLVAVWVGRHWPKAFRSRPVDLKPQPLTARVGKPRFWDPALK